ncbi:MAG: DNA repair exonuclease [Microthrixaceae bacterium]
MARFVHTADWQLGMTRHFLDEDAQPRFTQARIDAIHRIGQLAREQDCDFVVVGGDVFETNFVDRGIVIRALDAMRSTPEVRYYLLPGNHDPLDASSVFDSPAFAEHAPDNVVVLRDEPVTDPSGVQIAGAPWRSKRPEEDLVAAALRSAPADGAARVVVGHGAVDTLSPDRDDPALISLSSLETAIEEGRARYVALGDRHSTTEVGSSGAIHYSGAPEPTDYDEVDPGNVLVVQLDADGMRVEPHRVGTWSFARRRFELSGRDDCDEVRRFIDALPEKSNTILKLSLVGQVSLAVHAEFESMLEDRRHLLGALEIWDRHSDLVTVPDDDDLDWLQLSGYAQEAAEELRSAASTPADTGGGEVAGEALRLLYRLAGADRAHGGIR